MNPSPTYTSPRALSTFPHSPRSLPIMDGDELIASVYRKIEREKALIAAATNMRQSTDNTLVQQRVDANIRDGRKNIAYLEEKMRELQIRHMEQSGAGSPASQRQGPGPTPPPKDSTAYFGGEGDVHYPQGGSGSMPSGAPFPDPRPYAPIPKARPNYTKLGRFNVKTHSLPILTPVLPAPPRSLCERRAGPTVR